MLHILKNGVTHSAKRCYTLNDGVTRFQPKTLNDALNDTFVKDMCMSASSLYKKLRTLTGQNVSAFINSIKMKEACKLAKSNPYMPVNEVYILLGYSTPAYFSRLFKSEFGMTFKEYQEKVLSENKQTI